jgi:hypothetical protein
MHLYAFGSICRGDVSRSSDIDLLAVVEGFDERFDPNVYSIYSYQRVREIWDEGNPFAWHLATESKLLFSTDGSDLLQSLGNPGLYRACRHDCRKFYQLFADAKASLAQNDATKIFDLSMVFLGIRNFATCFSLGCLQKPDFSRHSALRLGTSSLPIAAEPYSVFERARILCTRGHGPAITDGEVDLAVREFPVIEEWMTSRLSEVPVDGT